MSFVGGSLNLKGGKSGVKKKKVKKKKADPATAQDAAAPSSSEPADEDAPPLKPLPKCARWTGDLFQAGTVPAAWSVPRFTVSQHLSALIPTKIVRQGCPPRAGRRRSASTKSTLQNARRSA